MKQKILMIIGMFMLCAFVQAQTIKYESSLTKARALALQTKKPIAILITITPPVPSPNFMRSLSDPSVVEKFNNYFINYKVAREDTAISRKIISEYKVSRFPALVFLDEKGGLLFKDVASSYIPKPLLDMADKAMASKNEMSIVDFDSSYKAGNKNREFLKEYITKRQRAGITDNANLIETYVNGLNISDLNNYEEVLFILKAGPIVDSNAYKLARTNKKIVDSIFKNELLADRIAMNNASIYNTLSKAIAGKDLTAAMAAANFSRTSYGNNYKEGYKNMQAIMLQYHLGVKDTVRYLENAVVYFDSYYMNMTLDSVRKKDSLNYQAARRNAKVIEEIKVDEKLMRRTTTFAYAKDSYATALNNAAWNVFKLGGNRNEFLIKAMLWSKRSIEHSPKAAYYDTYAHILYKLKLFSEAETMQKNAIESARAEKIDSKGFEKEYEKIRNKTL